MSKVKGNVYLKIADAPFLITSREKNIVDVIKKGFQEFVSSPDKSAVRISVTVREDFAKNPYEDGRPHQITVNDLGDYVTASGNSFTGWLNLKERKAEVSLSASVAAFYLFLRFVVVMVLSRGEGFILHACSVRHNGFGYIFAGRPNTGKSTMAQLSSEKKVLSDDFSIIKKVDGEFRVFPSPFWGKIKPGGKNENDSYPIKAIYFLNHSDDNFIRPVKSWQKRIALLHQNILMFPTLRDYCNNIFKLENELIEKVPLSKLYFVPNNTVWRCIDA